MLGKFPTDGSWAQVAAGESHTCAISDAGEATCWGANNVGQGSVPSY